MTRVPVESARGVGNRVERLARLTENPALRLVSGVVLTGAAWFLGGWMREALMTVGVVALALSVKERWRWKILFVVGVLAIAAGFVTLAATPVGVFFLVLGAVFVGRAIQLERKHQLPVVRGPDAAIPRSADESDSERGVV